MPTGVARRGLTIDETIDEFSVRTTVPNDQSRECTGLKNCLLWKL